MVLINIKAQWSERVKMNVLEEARNCLLGQSAFSLPPIEVRGWIEGVIDIVFDMQRDEFIQDLEQIKRFHHDVEWSYQRE